MPGKMPKALLAKFKDAAKKTKKRVAKKAAKKNQGPRSPKSAVRGQDPSYDTPTSKNVRGRVSKDRQLLKRKKSRENRTKFGPKRKK